jgi:hypothetical protein
MKEAPMRRIMGTSSFNKIYVHGSAGKKAVLVAPTLSAADLWTDIYI